MGARDITEDPIEATMVAALSQRLRRYWEIGRQMLACGILIPCWLVLIWLFFKKTSIWIGRLHHLGMTLNDPMCIDSQYDFSMFWSVGKMAAAHNYVNIYNPSTFSLWRHLHLCANAVQLPWINLPPALLPSYAISFLPFKLGLVVWLLSSIVGTVILLRWAKLSWFVVVAGLLSPAALFCLEKSQFGVMMDVFFIAMLVRSDDRPRLAGSVLGLLILKPQAALLAPFILLAKKNWQAIFAAAAMVIFILICTIVIFGVPVWQAYWQIGRHVENQVLTANSHTYELFGVSVFWMLRSLGAGIEISLLLQGVSFCFAAALVWYIWRRVEISRTDRLALTVFLSLLATPYGYTHDMVGYSVALACLAERRGWRIDLLDVLFWLWPIACSIVTKDTGILLTPVVVGLAIIRTWVRADLGIPRLPLWLTPLSKPAR